MRKRAFLVAVQVVVIAVMMLYVTRPALASTVWQPANGPYGGNVRALAIDPTDSQTAYAGVFGGVFKTVNGGTTWTTVANELTGTLVNALAIDPASTQTIYAGTYIGVFKSTNGGASWTAVYGGSPMHYIDALVIDPTDSQTVYAGTGDGVYKTTDGGTTWTITNSGLPATYASSLAIDPTNSQVIYAAVYDPNGGIFKTTNGGTTWTAVNSGVTSTYVKALAIDPSNSQTVYAGTDSGVFKSVNGGTSWTAVNSGLTDTSIHSIAIDPGNSQTLYAGVFGVGHAVLFKTTNGGTTWTAVNTLSTTTDISAIAVDPSNGQVVYEGTGIGILKTVNGGTAWADANTGLSATEVETIVVDPTSSQTVYAGTLSSGVFKSSNGGTNWVAVNSGLPYTFINTLAIDPTNTQTVYAGSAGVFKSTNGGASWAAVNNGFTGTGNNGVRSLSIDPTGSQTIYAATDGYGIFKTINGGTSWTAVNGMPDPIVMDPTNGQTMYAWGNGGIVKTVDGGSTWTDANSGLTTSVSTLSFDPLDSQILYAAAYGLHVFKSINGGTTWTALNYGVGGIVLVNAVVIDPTNGLTLYAGTNSGVYKSTNGGASWRAVNSGLDNTYVLSLAIGPDGQTVYAGTAYGGMFRAEITPDPPGSPTNVTATIGSGQVMVTFTPPVDTGGSAITGYTVTAQPGNLTATGAASPITVTGFSNETDYTFTVVATNAAGSSPASGPSNSVTPLRRPLTPTIGAVTPGNGQATVLFTPPADDGGSAITGYTVTAQPGNLTATGTASPITVSGLTNGTAYTFTIVATNAVGNSAESAASNNVTPCAVPGSPTIGTATAGYGQATVAFTPPADNGGSAITAYTVTAQPGTITVTATASPITVIGLSNDTSYTFTVVATNQAGNSPASAPSNNVTPIGSTFYTVTPGTAANVQIMPPSAQSIVAGQATIITIIPDPGYGVTVTGCGGTLAGAIYTTGHVTGNCAVEVTSVRRSGSTNGAAPNISDALAVLRATLSLASLTPEERIRYDVAPLDPSGTPVGNGVLDVADALVVLRRSLGIGAW